MSQINFCMGFFRDGLSWYYFIISRNFVFAFFICHVIVFLLFFFILYLINFNEVLVNLQFFADLYIEAMLIPSLPREIRESKTFEENV